MTTLVTNRLKEHIGDQLIESINEPANNVYYVVASKHTQYSGGDSTIPEPEDTFKENDVSIYEEGIFGKKITSSDIIQMIPKYIWTSNTVYTPYDDSDSDLFNRQFYVAVDSGATYYIYKCLDNNRGAISNTSPGINTSESACNFITTSDGYTWKLMYSMSEATFEKFATDEYMPVTTSANVAGNTVSGAIDVIRITNTGSNYVATLTGQFQVDDLRSAIPTTTGNTTTYRLTSSASSNTDFYVGSALYISSGTGGGQIKSIVDYNAATRVAVVNSAFTVAPDSTSTYLIAPNVTITGDGSGASAYASVTSNSSVNNFISKINMVSRGSGYTYSTGTVSGNTGGVANTASVKVVIPPIGGHGKDSPTELGAKATGISVTFNTNESGFISTENDYRKIVILKDPLFQYVTLTLGSEIGTFSAGESVYQIEYKTLSGTIAGNTTSLNITGIGTELDKAIKTNDYVYITDSITGTSCLRTVAGVVNATAASLNDELPFVTSFARIAHASVVATGIKSGNSSPYLTMSNAQPKFVTGKIVIGAASGAVANVTAIDVNEKNYNNWITFDNRTKIAYTSSSGSMPEDAVVYQTDISQSNAIFHSANSTYVFLTADRGPINADPNDLLIENGGSATYTLGSVKYVPDLVKGSGKVLYIESNTPISRSNSQSETIKLIIKF